jgi:hypothetical protein
MYKVEPVDKITPELVAEAEELATKAGRLEEKIVDRLHYIVTSIFKLFNKKDAYWYFYGAAEGEVGDLWSHYDIDSISIVADNCPDDSMVILLKDGSEWGLDDGIPTRWLFEDFEQEVVNGKTLYEAKLKQHKANEKEKRFLQKEEDKKLVEIAKAKLTKKELAAIRKAL